MLSHDALVAIPYALAALFGLLIFRRWIRLINSSRAQRRADPDKSSQKTPRVL